MTGLLLKLFFYLEVMFQSSDHRRRQSQKYFHRLALSSPIFPSFERPCTIIGFFADRFAISNEIEVNVVAIWATKAFVPIVTWNRSWKWDYYYNYCIQNNWYYFISLVIYPRFILKYYRMSWIKTALTTKGMLKKV